MLHENTEKFGESKDKCSCCIPRKRKIDQNLKKDSVSARFKNVLRYCVLHCCIVIYLRLSMYNKIIIEFDFL